jgi:accessory gene regulator protein AgrB
MVLIFHYLPISQKALDSKIGNAQRGEVYFFLPPQNLKGFHMKHQYISYLLSITILVLSSALTIYHYLFDHEWVGMFFIAIMSGVMVYCSQEEYDG